MLTSEQVLEYIKLSSKIIQWSYIVTSIVSLIGNTTAAGIYLTKTFKGQLVRFYCPIILFLDIIPLLIGSSSYWAHYLFTTTDIFCKIMIYMANVSPLISSWVSTMLSVDQAVQIFYPNRFEFLKKFKTRVGFHMILFALASALVLQLVIQLEPSTFDYSEMNCVYYPPLDYDFRIYFLVYFIFYTVLPFIIMLISSTLMIRRLKTIKRNSGKLDNAEAKRIRKFSRIVLSLNFFFLVSVLPYSLINIVRFIIESLNSIPQDVYVCLALAYSIANMILYIHYSASIVIHLICNRHFRNAFVKLFFCFKANIHCAFKCPTDSTN